MYSNGFFCNFLDFERTQYSKVLTMDIFDKLSEPEYAGIDMICVPHVDSFVLDVIRLSQWSYSCLLKAL